MQLPIGQVAQLLAKQVTSRHHLEAPVAGSEPGHVEENTDEAERGIIGGCNRACAR